MQFDVITPFPKVFEGIFEESILRQAQKKGLVTFTIWDLREFTTDKHRTVDDYPYGGGAGMILKPEPIFQAVEAIREKHPDSEFKTVFMSPQGETYNQSKAQELAKERHLVFLCGHYRGVDERVIEALVDEEISIGDYILSGGELPAAVVIDSIVRLQRGVLGNFDSAEADSFVSGRLDYPHYTRPEEFQGMRVPEVLLSGHHAEVEKWRMQQALERTQKRRPDLLQKKEELNTKPNGSERIDTDIHLK
jgi:tRNA (guanine37-N1)-methyltransferase